MTAFLNLRTSMPSNDDEKLFTENVCKIEFRNIFCTHLFVFVIGFVLVQFLASFSAYQLPYDFYIIFLPPQNSWFSWAVNYIFLAACDLIITIFLACYVSLPLLLMNHSCWLLDMIKMAANEMNNGLQLDEDHECVDNSNERLRKIVDRCEKFDKWRIELQNLLRWNFNLEFQVQSTILCLSIYVLSFVSTGAQLVSIVIFISLLQLYAYCWMGSQISVRFDQVSHEVSKHFYLMKPSQRKSLLSILHWTQNMKGFSGTFNGVNLETFKMVCIFHRIIYFNYHCVVLGFGGVVFILYFFEVDQFTVKIGHLH